MSDETIICNQCEKTIVVIADTTGFTQTKLKAEQKKPRSYQSYQGNAICINCLALLRAKRHSGDKE